MALKTRLALVGAFLALILSIPTTDYSAFGIGGLGDGETLSVAVPISITGQLVVWVNDRLAVGPVEIHPEDVASGEIVVDFAPDTLVQGGNQILAQIYDAEGSLLEEHADHFESD